MGEEKEEKEKKEEGKEEEKKDEEPQEIVLKVDMHCHACARKVARALQGFEGVEHVTADCKARKVVVKGKAADPIKVCQRIQKKSGRKVEIISPVPVPIPKPPVENKQLENNQEPQQEKQEKKEEKQPPAVTTVAMKVRMHCDACARALQKRIGKVKGVESVTTDIANNHVIVKGVLDTDKLVNEVHRRTRKQVAIVKNEEKKVDEKKDEKPDDKKEESKEEDDHKIDIKKSEYWPPEDYMGYAYVPQIFSDENPNACSVM